MILAVTDGYMPLAPWGGVTVADVRQVAKGLISAMESGTAGERYILGGTNIRYLELWRKMAGLAGRNGPRGKLGPFNAYVAGKAADCLSIIRGKETEVNSAGIAISSKFNYYDSSKAQQQLGYDPGDLETALNDAWQWLRENGYTRHSK